MHERYAWFLPRMWGDNCNVSVGRNEVQRGYRTESVNFNCFAGKERKITGERERVKREKIWYRIYLDKSSNICDLTAPTYFIFNTYISLLYFQFACEYMTQHTEMPVLP